ncbi:hypothetical protein VP1G_05589 [Cytospora mali]|uniref:Major facilitator superfamily (MFS) profile domain-containing protein n=1 Tax=Cytospora mali TaxID=578113 RepID=A0A194V323_CYTMA|nr:hypothetical protein VP1G_05589 [Valsa mali var. pyri (nom. inval.)]
MKTHMAAGWFYSPEQIRDYLLTRPTSLKPPRTKLRNPIRILGELDSHQWHMFSAGYIAWTWDAFDFFTVSLTVTEIAKDFGVSNTDVTWGITVTLMLRSVGALIFGAISDHYGRKWPMIVVLVLFIILELASGFAQNLTQFLAIRSLYGIAMGGLFGPAAATSLEDLPYDARGLLSGMVEQGFGMGYLLAAVFYRATHRFLFVYMILLMTGFNSTSHGSQDLYATFLKNQVGINATEVTVISVVGQIGALFGTAILGYLSTFFGRRLTMCIACIFGGAIIPAYVLPHSLALMASAFVLQFFIAGVWGPIPIYLSEFSPDTLRATMVGLTYQIGNLGSSASATIQAIIGERFPLEPKNGVKRYDYGKVIGIFMGAVWAYDLLFLFLGPEINEEKNAGFAAEANELEALRRAGVSLAEIGAERARASRLEKQAAYTEQPVGVEHVETQQEEADEVIRQC